MKALKKNPIEVYKDALEVSSTGYTIVHERDIDEIYINNYNPGWIRSWNANMDLQLCLDFFAVITYISDYYSKDDSGTLKHIKEALREAGNEPLKAKLSLVAHTFLTHRQIGESEAFFRILPHLNMKHSNIESIFVPTGLKKNISSFLKKLIKSEAENCSNVVQVSERPGFYVEKSSMINKFERMDCDRNRELSSLT